MLRWRRDKPVAEIDTLEALRGLLAAAGGPATRTPRDI
jgi:DNA ligase-1